MSSKETENSTRSKRVIEGRLKNGLCGILISFHFRSEFLKVAAVDITPTEGKLPWSGKSVEEAEKEWLMKRVVIKGIFDHDREEKIDRTKNGMS
jgi:hypothetical protein